MSVDEQYENITQYLEEVIDEELIKQTLENDGKLRIYWGTATTGKPHVGYFVPMFKIADFLAAGCDVTILLADLHGFLDNMKSNWELLGKRVDYYEFIIRAMLDRIGVDQENLKFVRGTDYQLSPEYTLDMYKMTANLTTQQTEKAGAEVVKQVEHPLMSSLLYPILQALDEQYLDVNVQFGGVDQRKIFMFARTHLPKIGYARRAYLMNPLVPGLGKPEGDKPAKMSSSEPLSKIDFDDSNKSIKNKFKKSFSVDGVVENNGLLALTKYVIFRFVELEGRTLIVPRPDRFGGPLEYASYEELEAAFGAGELASGDLKTCLAREIINIIAPIKEQILGEMKPLYEEAYPVKKQAKRQNIGQADYGSLDVRVGRVLSVEKHPNADTLYVEQIDLGEEAPRTIVSGLVNFYEVEQFQGKDVLVVCNLDPRKARGILSEGMVLCASNAEHDTVLLLEPPEGSNPGDRVIVEGYVRDEPEAVIKSKRWKRIAKDLATNENGAPCYKGIPFQTTLGPIQNTPLLNGLVS